MTVPNRILPVIVFSQFAGTSLWFAGNAIIADLQVAMNVGIDDTGIVTSAIQLGFITGTSFLHYLPFQIDTHPESYSLSVQYLVQSQTCLFISSLMIYFHCSFLDSSQDFS